MGPAVKMRDAKISGAILREKGRSRVPEQISVVIITMNRRALIERSVPILLDDPATGELIVVVDGARDGTMEVLEGWAERDGRVRPIWQENAGEGAARGNGVAAARHDVVVLLDDDVIPTADLVTRHAMRHSIDSVDVVLGYMPTTVPTPRRRGQVPTILYSQDYEKTCLGYQNHPEDIWSHFWSGNFSVRRDHALAVGLKGGIRLGYHEDLYFGLRCQEAGLTAVFDREAVGNHTHSRSLRKFSREVRRAGEARAILMHWFPDFRDLADPFFDTSGPQRVVLTTLSIPWIRAVATPTLMAVSWFAGIMRFWALETDAARVMRQVELVYSFRKRMKVDMELRPVS